MNAAPTNTPSHHAHDLHRPARLLADHADREIVLLPGARGSRLVVDRLADGSGDARLVAHLTADEPDLNAVVVTDIYLADPARAARRVTAEDFVRLPLAHPSDEPAHPDRVLFDPHGIPFRLAPVRSDAANVPELRWLRQPPAGSDGPAQCVSARRVVGALEDYQPVRSLTAAAIARHRHDPALSVATLGLELRRLGASPIVLNRRLREAVIDASIRRGLSFSAIALACGRTKYDRRGRRSGETSWLARRIGLLGDDAVRRPSPWVHSDVLGLIARDGLGLAPHEVELG
jgi:hypothetical protein